MSAVNQLLNAYKQSNRHLKKLIKMKELQELTLESVMQMKPPREVFTQIKKDLCLQLLGGSLSKKDAQSANQALFYVNLILNQEEVKEGGKDD